MRATIGTNHYFAQFLGFNNFQFSLAWLNYFCLQCREVKNAKTTLAQWLQYSDAMQLYAGFHSARETSIITGHPRSQAYIYTDVCGIFLPLKWKTEEK